MWRRHAVAALTALLQRTDSVRGVLGLHEEKLGRQLMKRGDLDGAAIALESALANVAHWDDATKHVRSALKKLRKLRRRAGEQTS